MDGSGDFYKWAVRYQYVCSSLPARLSTALSDTAYTETASYCQRFLFEERSIFSVSTNFVVKNHGLLSLSTRRTLEKHVHELIHESAAVNSNVGGAK